MKPMILIFCLLGAVCANPLLHKMAMEMIKHASNSSESSSISESSEQSNASDPSDEVSKDNTSESKSSESLESDSGSKESESHSVESLTGKSETAMTSDNTQSSNKNVRRGWIYTLKWVHANYTKMHATGHPDEDDKTDGIKSIGITDGSTGATSIPSESSESSESQETFGLSSTREDNGADTSESAEHGYAVDGTGFGTGNSSSSSSSESIESSKSAADDNSRSVECVPGADSPECDSEENFPQDIGDDGATDPFNGFLMPDDNEL